MKVLYGIGFFIILPIHLILLGIIKIIELIGKGLCYINDIISDWGNTCSDNTPQIQRFMDNLTLKAMKWKNR